MRQQKKRNVDTVVITQKKSESSQPELNPWPSRCWLDALTTELWETRGERGHITRFISVFFWVITTVSTFLLLTHFSSRNFILLSVSAFRFCPKKFENLTRFFSGNLGRGNRAKFRLGNGTSTPVQDRHRVMQTAFGCFKKTTTVAFCSSCRSM